MDEETASSLAVATGAFPHSMEMVLDRVEELLSGDWNLHFHGSSVCFMVPMSFINVRALVEGEIKKCVEYNIAFPKRMWCTNYVLPSGIHLVTRIRFLPLLIMVSQASNDAAPAVVVHRSQHDGPVRHLEMSCRCFRVVQLRSKCSRVSLSAYISQNQQKNNLKHIY